MIPVTGVPEEGKKEGKSKMCLTMTEDSSNFLKHIDLQSLMNPK